MNKEKYIELVEDLFMALTKELELKISKEMTIEEKRKMIDMLSVVCPVGVLDEEFFSKQEKVLSYEKSLKVVIDETLVSYKKKQASVNCDLFTVNADFCVVFTSNLICGYTQDLNNIDNQIAIHGGLEINESYYNLLKENNYILLETKPYIVDTKNLTFNKLAKILIKDLNNLDDNFQNIKLAVDDVFEYAKQNNLKNLVFNLNNFKNKETIKNIKNLINYSKNNKKYKNFIIFIENI